MLRQENLPLEYITTDLISQSFVIGDSGERIILKASIPGLDNMYAAEIYRPPKTPLADFTQFILNTLELTNNTGMQKKSMKKKNYPTEYEYETVFSHHY